VCFGLEESTSSTELADPRTPLQHCVEATRVLISPLGASLPLPTSTFLGSHRPGDPDTPLPPPAISSVGIQHSVDAQHVTMPPPAFPTVIPWPPAASTTVLGSGLGSQPVPTLDHLLTGL